MIKEKLEDIAIQYYYSKDFQWLDPMFSERYQGHPRPGQVYRAIVNDSKKNTKLLITEHPTWNALVMNDFTKGMQFDGSVEPITLKNILDLNLSESELDRILNWQEQDNKDLKRLYKPQPDQVVLMTLAEAMNNQAKEEAADMNDAVNLLSALRITDPIGFNIILELIDALGQDSMESRASSALATDPQFSTGINMSRVMDSVCRYIGDDRRTNFDRADLIQAFLGIVNELKAIELE